MTGWKKFGSRWLLRSVLGALLIILAAGVIAPFVNARPFSGSIQHALESSLGRRVSFDAVHFAIFTGPGFSLSGVTIQEDPRYGLEPFAYVPTLQARLRVDALLRGRIAISSLKLVSPSLNIVKQDNGHWNVVELVSRLTAPSRLPLDFFPAFSVSGARLDFKIGARKTTFYVTDADLSLYPQHSGKLYVQFSGSPARSDQAGNGFGHLRGNVTWYVHPDSSDANQLEANISLDPSNLSELTTLVQGHDAGVQAMVSSTAHIEGPASALRIAGNLTLNDVHRWDLLPEAGEAWRVGYRGDVNLVSQVMSLQSVPVKENENPPVVLRVRVNDFLRNASWSMLASLTKAPAAQLLPIAQRMGIALPQELKLDGSVDGAVSYTSDGFSGAVAINDVSVALPKLPVLRANTLVANIDQRGIRVQPCEIQTDTSGSMLVGVDYNQPDQHVQVSLQPADFPIAALRETAAQFFGSSDFLSIVHKGNVTGRFLYDSGEGKLPQWSGQFRFADADLKPEGMSEAVTSAAGQARFSGDSLDLDHFSGSLGPSLINASYHNNATSLSPARMHIVISALDLRALEEALQPTLQGQGLLERLGVSRRHVPSWLAARSVQVDLTVANFSIAGNAVGSLKTNVAWQGPRLELTKFDLHMPDGDVQGAGTLNLASSSPEYRFTAAVSGYHWRGGLLSAEGSMQTTGLGPDAIENLRAEGTFSGQDVSVSTDDQFTAVSGAFQFSFADGWADLKLPRLEVSDGDESWTGSASSLSDGKLIIDLEHEGKQRHVISTLQQPAPVSSVLLHPQDAR